MAGDNRSSEGLHVEKSTTDDEEMREDEDEDESDEDDDEDEGGLVSTEADVGKELSASQIETLPVPSCYRGAEVPEEFTLRRHESAELKSKVRGSHQEALASVIAQAKIQNQLQSHTCPPSSSTTSSNTQEHKLGHVENVYSLCASDVNQKYSPSPNTQEDRLALVDNIFSLCGSNVNKRINDSLSTLSSPSGRKYGTDGYNWRKYGQKQVKSPQGSRSYYRCSITQCNAKKIECFDHSNLVTEIIYKGQHNHDPPKKVNRGRESKVALSPAPISVISNTSRPVLALMDTDPSTSLKVGKLDMPSVPELKRPNTNDLDRDEFKDKEEHTDDQEPIGRAKKNSSSHSGSLPKTAKKPKLVVHAAGDMEISGDGYRWRKYGQKMVKGNPHPRNYYRCTTAGCPARKHIENAVDSSSGFIITCKGTHNHEMPVPKKVHATSSILVASPSPASANNSGTKKGEDLSNQESPTPWSVSAEGRLTGEALKVKGEKPVDPAWALVSIGFEIKPC